VETVDASGAATRMPVPSARGPLSDALRRTLLGPPPDPTASDATDLTLLAAEALDAIGSTGDVLLDDDVQVSLTALYELHYRGLSDVDDDWEWQPALLRARAMLERRFERALRAMVPIDTARTADEVVEALHVLTEPSRKPGLSSYLARRADLEQYRELLVHRSVYHLKEADPHSWAIPRLAGATKAALVEIQADEYGGGRPEWVHARLFAQSMRLLGLDDAYGRYVDAVPAASLAVVNAMSLFGLHRRLRGALVGHLAAFEMTSTLPNKRYAQGLRRIGVDERAVVYFDEHVEADAVHEQIAARDLAGGLVSQEPQLAADVLFGAGTAVALDAVVSEHLLRCWRSGRSSLRAPVADSPDLRSRDLHHATA
jgi:hypothetical protein